MKATFLICCILALALLGLSCAPEAKLEISVTEVDNGVMIENVGNVACLVFVSSPEGEQASSGTQKVSRLDFTLGCNANTALLVGIIACTLCLNM